MLEFFLSPIASWFGVSIPIFLLCLIVFLLILNIFRG